MGHFNERRGFERVAQDVCSETFLLQVREAEKFLQKFNEITKM
jgi:hypothetical protein